MKECELDNALVAVKNILIESIDSENVTIFGHCLFTMQTMHRVFNTCNYHYKMVELSQRALRILYRMRADTPMQAKLRRAELSKLIDGFVELVIQYRNAEQSWILCGKDTV